MLKKRLIRSKARALKNSNLISKTAKVLLVFLFLAVFCVGTSALAQNNFGLQGLEQTGLPSASLGVVVARIINAALGLLGLTAVVIIIYGGYLYMTARGEVEKVQRAKKLLVQAIIGLIIIVLSFAIAQFLFFILGINPWVSGGGGNVQGNVQGGGGGALGAGIIYSHYPARNAKNVPRNTKIFITFKEKICTDSAKAGSFVKNGKINSGANGPVKFYIQPAKGLSPELIGNISVISDQVDSLGRETIGMQPDEFLGNDNTNTPYTFEMTNLLAKGDCATSAFGNFGGYKWSFEVSTKLDLTPPQIVSVIPLAVTTPVTAARNTVIQINFNEAIDPTTLAGKAVVTGGGTVGTLAGNSYDLMTVQAGDQFVAGEFYLSNQYRTAEFITNDPCGVNSCGNKVYCLPSNQLINVLIKAATLAQAGKPTAATNNSLLSTKGSLYDGLVDMAGNSLDGNHDGVAQGPVSTYDMNVGGTSSDGDNATWKFNTNNIIDLVPPQIQVRLPENGTNDVDPDNDLSLAFDKNLMFTSLIPNATLILDQMNLADSQKSSYEFIKNTNNDQNIVLIKTSGLWVNHVYNIIANSGIKDSTQNCYMPCADLSNCLRTETQTPGQYIQGNPWKGNYPSCDLTQ